MYRLVADISYFFVYVFIKMKKIICLILSHFITLIQCKSWQESYTVTIGEEMGQDCFFIADIEEGYTVTIDFQVS